MIRPFSALILAAALAQPVAAQQRTAAPTEPPTRQVGNVILSGVPRVPVEIAETFEPYGDVRSASFADWTRDGRGIYISTRFGNVPQLYRVEAPQGTPRQLTRYDEPIRGAERRPGNAELLFSMDEGGGEFNQLFLLDPATGRARRLTDGQSRNGSALWSPDGARIAFTSTRRNGRSNDIWTLNVADTASARMVLQATDGASWGASDWNAAHDRLLVTQYVSANDSRLHLLDLRTGARTPLAGDSARPASYTGISPVFNRAGTGIFLATDARGEFQQLAHMDLGSRRLQIITGDIPWDVEEFDLNEARTRGAFVVNEGGTSRLYLFDPATRRYTPVTGVPMGIIGGLEFAPDGRRLAMTVNNATTPSDVFVLELGDGPLQHGALTRWTTSEVGGLDPEEFVAPERIEYPTFDGRTIPAFVYKPKGSGPHPVIISIHGGPEGQYRPGFNSTFQAWVNELGAAVIAPNVRGSAGYGKSYLRLDNAQLRENSVRDIGALLDWVRAQPDLDEDRVMVYGGSYGGYMVLASLVHFNDRLRGGVDIVGISDFVTFLQNTQEYRQDLRRAEYGDERDPEMRAFFERIAPARQADKITTPLLVIQGQNDPRVPVSEAEQIVREVRGNGRPVWYMNALDEGHGYAKKANQDLMRDVVVMFFREHLLPEG